MISTTTTKLNDVLKCAIEDRITPAIAAEIGTLSAAAPKFSVHEGTLSLNAQTHCSSSTVFDLASLTKVLSTTLIAAEAITLGKLALDETPFEQWPDVSVADLLQHASGLPASKNLYVPRSTRNDTIDRALQISQLFASKTHTIYSDIGFIALGSLLESRLKDRIDVVFNDLSQKYFGPSSLSYRPTDAKISDTSNIAPTGWCQTRHRYLHGVVNDLNTFGMRGVASHAGLFGTLEDVAIAARFFLTSMKKPTSPISRTIAQFARADGKRALGFDKAERAGSTDGVLSKHAVGHLGFTGTSLWIDPAAANGEGAYFILLTNHLEASSRKVDLMQLRRDFHRAGARWLNEQSSFPLRKRG